MKTEFLLLAQYDGLSVIPANIVCRDYFPHLTTEKFLRKLTYGDIKLPLIRMENSQKSAKGIHIGDLAKYVDARRADAIKDIELMSS
jgi:Pyocin activator protein PrtN